MYYARHIFIFENLCIFCFANSTFSWESTKKYPPDFAFILNMYWYAIDLISFSTCARTLIHKYADRRMSKSKCWCISSTFVCLTSWIMNMLYSNTNAEKVWIWIWFIIVILVYLNTPFITFVKLIQVLAKSRKKTWKNPWWVTAIELKTNLKQKNELKTNNELKTKERI